jgi:hypothetical protein
MVMVPLPLALRRSFPGNFYGDPQNKIIVENKSGEWKAVRYLYQ